MSRKAKRRIYVLAVIFFIAVFALVICSNMNTIERSNNPTSLVEQAIKAVGSGDLDSIDTYFSPSAARIMRTRLSNYLSACDDIKITNIQTLLIYEENLTARVSAQYDIICTAHGDNLIDHYSKTVKLIKNNSQWLINEAL